MHAHLITLNHQNMTSFKKAWYRLQETLLIIKYDVYVHTNIYDIHNLMNIHNDYTSVNLRFALHLNHLCHLVCLLHLECFVFFVKPCVGTPVSRYLWLTMNRITQAMCKQQPNTRATCERALTLQVLYHLVFPSAPVKFVWILNQESVDYVFKCRDCFSVVPYLENILISVWWLDLLFCVNITQFNRRK